MLRHLARELHFSAGKVYFIKKLHSYWPNLRHHLISGDSERRLTLTNSPNLIITVLKNIILL